MASNETILSAKLLLSKRDIIYELDWWVTLPSLTHALVCVIFVVPIVVTAHLSGCNAVFLALFFLGQF